jgi:hypothetical protein
MARPGFSRALLIVAATATAAAAEPREVTSRRADISRGATTAPLRDLPLRLPQLGLVVYDIHDLLQSRYADLVLETSAIFLEMGVDTGWRRGGLGTVHGGGPLREIPVILLEKAPGRLKSQREVLGLIPKDQPPAIWVFVDNVRRAIGPPASADGHQLAVAIGRVVAHEIVHSLAPQLGHTRSGLMRHSLDREALVGTSRPSHAECAAAVRAALKLAAPASGVSPSLAAVLPFPPRY